MVNLRDLRKSAKLCLDEAGCDHPLADIDFVLRSMGFTKDDILRGEKIPGSESRQEFWSAIERLKSHEPVQYIVGKTEFMSLDFKVSPDTLIPRADTEILVEAVIDLCKSLENPEIFEVGTGSGCIAVSFAHYIEGAKVTSVDISGNALTIAKQNAIHNHTDVAFFELDILDGFPAFDKAPDIIVSNPPYIPSNDINFLDRKVKDYEPISALDGGNDGLDFYRFITSNAPLAPGGFLVFEVGIGQSRQVAQLMQQRFEDIKIIKDLAEIERVVVGKLNGHF